MVADLQEDRDRQPGVIVGETTHAHSGRNVAGLDAAASHV